MSGTRAVDALMSYDSTLSAFIEQRNDHVLSHAEAVVVVKEMRSLWTVGLAADAAGVSEEVVCAAMLYRHLKVGSYPVCQGIAKIVYRENL